MNETNDDLWEVVATASGMTQANIIVGRLASDGIGPGSATGRWTDLCDHDRRLGRVPDLVSPVPDWGTWAKDPLPFL